METERGVDQLAWSEEIGDGQFRWDVPDGWQQGRGAFGGLVVSAGINALHRTANTSEMKLRAVQAILGGPVVTGAADISVRQLRRGSNTLALACDIVQEGETKCHLTGFYGSRRVDDGDWSTTPPPEMPDWRELDVAHVGPPMAPVFAEKIEFRVVGAYPFSGADEARVEGWVRPKTAGQARDEGYLAVAVDTFWPAFFSQLEMPRPAATILFQMEFLRDLDEESADQPIYFRSTAPESRDGYMVEFRELWSARGELLAMNQQSFCIIK